MQLRISFWIYNIVIDVIAFVASELGPPMLHWIHPSGNKIQSYIGILRIIIIVEPKKAIPNS